MAHSNAPSITANRRLLITAACGLVAALIVSLSGKADLAPLAFWDTTGLLYVFWVMATVLRFDTAKTRSHATSESSSRTVSEVILVLAAIVSLVAVGFLVVLASNSSGLEKAVYVGLGLLSVVVSWAVVHTTYLLQYARLYYGDTEGGINFNQKEAPRYLDFAYLAFTLGMTFQVSDTDLETKEIRTTALKHALLSYLFGTVIIATTINTLASLSK